MIYFKAFRLLLPLTLPSDEAAEVPENEVTFDMT